jgi:HEAT repeat protein
LRQVESVPIIEAALFDETDPEVRREMVKALGNIADHSIIRVVSFLITDPSVKHEAVVALSKVPHRDALVTLENILNSTYSKEERVLALATIVKVSPGEAAPVLQRSLGWLPEDYVSKLAEELKAEALPLVVAALDSVNPRARLEAVKALRFMDQAKEMEILERELFSTKYADTKVYILTRLCELKGAEMLPILQSFFKDSDGEVRNTAVGRAALYVTPGTSDEDKLKDLLMDTNEGARVAASVAIMKIYGF